jgi:DNA topoisomerase-1
VQLGEMDDKEKKNSSLLKGMLPEEMTLATALQLLSLPRNLGKNPESDADIMAQNGKYGPYIVSGKETRSLPEELSPLDMTLEQALELLSQPKPGRGRRAAKTSEPLKAFDDSPITGKPIKVLSGRFGDYITDGVTNVTLPKGTSLEELTFDGVLDMLAVKAAKGPAPKFKKTRTAKTPVKKAAKKTKK